MYHAIVDIDNGNSPAPYYQNVVKFHWQGILAETVSAAAGGVAWQVKLLPTISVSGCSSLMGPRKHLPLTCRNPGRWIQSGPRLAFREGDCSIPPPLGLPYLALSWIWLPNTEKREKKKKKTKAGNKTSQQYQYKQIKGFHQPHLGKQKCIFSETETTGHQRTLS